MNIIFICAIILSAENLYANTDLKIKKTDSIEQNEKKEDVEQEEKIIEKAEKEEEKENISETVIVQDEKPLAKTEQSEKNDKENKSKSEKKKQSTTVVIEKAQRTEYRKNLETGSNIIVLEGDVKLSVTQSNSKTVITADLINFEKDRQMLYAEGNVKLQSLSNDKLSETLTATTLLFNVETLEGIFDAGRVVQEQTDALNLPSGSTLVVGSEIFGRDDSGTIAFKNAALTFCEDPDPHWKIKATRIWLLPGNEFAFFNALLYVGKLPVLYLPFFYYPKDEMIFNPAFGFDARRGYYVQTSTYIVGRKPLESKKDDDSFFDFMRPTQLKKQIREGLFLHNLEENDSNPDKYLKVLADYYSSLGGLVGVTGVFKPGKILTNVEFSANLGFSRTLFYDNYSDSYIPYYNHKTYYDSSALFGIKLPFRYTANFNASISHSIGNLTLSMPFYSDAYFDSDFLTNRKETMDWIDFLTNNPVLSPNETSTSETSSYTWSLTGNLRPPVTRFSPFISSLSLSSINSSITFYSKQTSMEAFKSMFDNSDLAQKMYYTSPQRKFYYPSQIVPFKATLNFAGTIVSVPKVLKKENKIVDEKTKINFIKPDDLKSDEEVAKEVDGIAETNNEENKLTKEDVVQKEIIIPDSVLPEIPVAFPSVTKNTSSGVRYNLTYSIVPVYSSLISYDSAKVLKVEDIDLTKVLSSFYSISVPVELKSALNLSSSFTLSNSIKFSAFNQAHPIMSEDENGYVGSNLKSTIMLNDYSARKLDVQNVNSMSWKPFQNNKYFSETSFSWNSTLKILRTSFDGTYDEPSWKYDVVGWDEDTFSAHNLSFVFSAKEKTNVIQKFTLQANLPPRDDSYMGQVSLTFPFVNFNAKTTFKKITDTDENVEWKWEPFTQSSTWSFFKKKLNINQSFNYEIEEKQSTAFTFGISFKNFTLSYSHQNTYGYNLTDVGWEIKEEKKFIPYSVSLNYSTPTKTFKMFKGKGSLSPYFSTSITADMIRPTNSYFTFSPTLKFSITNFIDISFSAESRNDVIFRYFQHFFNYEKKVPGETNIIKDLWDSFSFWSVEARRASGFKMKSLNFKIEHNLHDWDLTLEVKIQPTLITSKLPYKYNFDPYISLAVLWRPMSSMKTAIVSEYDATVDDIVIQLNSGD
ncbi:MAG: LPS-assembly protein LptD [Treponema sp.]|nr:LPS-assembly protein LptD [Treponema sp.]